MDDKIEQATDAVLDALEEADLTIAEAVAVLEIIKHGLLTSVDNGRPHLYSVQ